MGEQHGPVDERSYISSQELEQMVKDGLQRFHERRIANLASLRPTDLLKRKKPYLLKAIWLENAFDLVAELLRQYITASDETIFGDVFVEPIALAVSSDADFYIKLVRLMQEYPREHRRAFEKKWNRAVNRLGRYLLTEFADADGNIDWEKLVAFNSGLPAPEETKQ